MIAVLFSGGIDSLVHLMWAIKKFGRNNVQPVYFDIGQAYVEREFEAAKSVCNPQGFIVRKIQLTSIYEDRETGQLPLRNLFFLLHCAASTDPSYDGVVFGMLKAEEPADKNPLFVHRVQKLLDQQFAASFYRPVKKKFKIYTPFQNYNKPQMLRWYLRKYGNYMIDRTVACYVESGEMCGRCMSCFNRWAAWELCRLPMEKYTVHPGEAMLAKLKASWHNPQAKEWKLVNPFKIWRRRAWTWHTYKLLNRYCKKTYDMGLLRYLYS